MFSKKNFIGTISAFVFIGLGISMWIWPNLCPKYPEGNFFLSILWSRFTGTILIFLAIKLYLEFIDPQKDNENRCTKCHSFITMRPAVSSFSGGIPNLDEFYGKSMFRCESCMKTICGSCSLQAARERSAKTPVCPHCGGKITAVSA